eukprot:TRINITY_DN691_c0_g1_i1.p1 TRINITY_DN691_c0_g1~~TRINITY_DN691_c0_g1_i1.p1  ORF type:complete len:266 (+),score=-4.63 TRINITY_DN691_c0_g1_i1:726-1523(+)
MALWLEQVLAECSLHYYNSLLLVPLALTQVFLSFNMLDPYYSTLLLFSVVSFLLAVCAVVSYFIMIHPYVMNVLKDIQPNKPICELWTLAGKVFMDQGKSLFIVLMFTLMVFPGVAIAQSLNSVALQWSVPVIVFIYNTTDIIGKYLTGYFRFIPREHVFFMSAARVVIVVLICFYGYKTFGGFFVVDWWIIVNVSALGLTKGVLSTFAMMYSQDGFKEKNVAGSIMSFFLTIGPLVGSIFAQALFANLFQCVYYYYYVLQDYSL